jgi:hypothetical protein
MILSKFTWPFDIMALNLLSVVLSASADIISPVFSASTVSLSHFATEIIRFDHSYWLEPSSSTTEYTKSSLFFTCQKQFYKCSLNSFFAFSLFQAGYFIPKHI